ncbi:MAG TPA: pyridoxal phosphate-dependent aminotransferase [Candidatus Polarisedimenticolaceae bacterium]|nr:pyridoxal phosphate-dependent aminotransferase [Candidatus Polarisedimenticolaceae bacterium]
MKPRTALSDRAGRMPASPIRRLAPLADAASRAGRRVLRLNIGQPDIPTPVEMMSVLREYDEPNLPYGPSQGLPELIEALRLYHRGIGLELEAEHLFVTTGGSEALLFVFAAIADPGDELLVFEPFYTNYGGFAELVGVKTVPVTTRAVDGYHLPPRQQIEAALTDRTRAIVICNPNNPTGTVYTDDELERIAAICRDRGLYLVADEVYREFTYDGRVHRSALTLSGLDQQVVLTDSLSKRVSMCGARVGWIATYNRRMLDAVLRMGQARLCPPTLEQLVGARLTRVPSSYTERVVAEYQRRRDVVVDALQSMDGVTVRRPEGAFYVCPKLPIDDAQSFCEFLLRDFSLDGDTVILAPADGFYATPGLGRDEARIAYVLDTALLDRAMRVLAAALEAYPARVC